MKTENCVKSLNTEQFSVARGETFAYNEFVMMGKSQNNEKKPVGIVVNAFTEPFVFDSQIWDLVERMKSRIGSDGC